MATDLKSHAQDVDLTRFWGGDTRGVCVQVTTPAAKPLSVSYTHLRAHET